MKYRSVTGYTTRSCEDTHINSFSAISVEKRLKNVKFEEQLRKSNFFLSKSTEGWLKPAVGQSSAASDTEHLGVSAISLEETPKHVKVKEQSRN